MRLIIGLGNPGAGYAHNRHNVGFQCVDRLAREYNISFSRRHRHVLVGEGMAEERPVVLTKSRTYVNRSGQAVAYLLTRFRAAPQDLLIIYDDMDLPLGKIRIRPQGSAGGHNGMKSIIETLGTEEVPRLRLGIGRPPEDVDEVQYVLGDFSPQEQEALAQTLAMATQAVISILCHGIDHAMNRYN